MVLYRRQLPLLSQEEIGRELGLTVSEEVLEILPLALSGKKPVAGWGTQVQLPEYSLNTFFQRHSIPLRQKYIPPDELEHFADQLKTFLSNDDDLLVCFHAGTLYGKEADWGHVSLIDQISDGTVVLVDPAQNAPKFRAVEEALLLKAIIVHGKDRSGGIWRIFEVNSEN